MGQLARRSLIGISCLSLAVAAWVAYRLQADDVDAHDGAVRSLAYSPDGSVLASGGGDGWVKTWDVKTHRLLNAFPGNGGVIARVAFSRDGRILASAGRGTVAINDVRSGKLLRSLGTLDGA